MMITVTLPKFELKFQNKLTSIVCIAEEIQSLIEILNPNKASGPDGISYKMLKPVAKEVSVPLSILFNRSFREGRFADIWKHSHVIPLSNKASQAIQSPRTAPFLLLVPLLDGYSFANVLVKGIVAFKHKKERNLRP